mmetsp:Transcript_109616/g.353853  ORF Transcript_109616/g.353853 Transcript_109616/m.353853 type:complete len:338 (+) Transcript_109616:289-1302(+)
MRLLVPLVHLGNVVGEHKHLLWLPPVFPVEPRPACIVAARKARGMVPNQDRPHRLLFMLRWLEEIAGGDGAHTLVPLTRHAHRRRKVPDAIDLLVPAEVRVAEDVDVRLQPLDAAAQQRRAHELGERWEVEVALLGEELDARQKVAEGDDDLSRLPAPRHERLQPGGVLPGLHRPLVVQGVEVLGNGVVKAVQRGGPPAEAVVRTHLLRSRDAPPTLVNLRLAVEAGAMPAEERHDPEAHGAPARGSRQPAGSRVHALLGTEPLQCRELRQGVRAAVRGLLPLDPEVVVPRHEEDTGKLPAQAPHRLPHDGHVVRDVPGKDEHVSAVRQGIEPLDEV